MIHLPEVKENDELYGLIYIPQWLYKNKHLRLLCYCYPFAGCVYLCVLLHCALTNRKNLVSLDVLVAALCLEVTLSCVSILDQEESLLEISRLRARHFWDGKFLNKREKRNFDKIAKISVYLHSAWWVIAMIVVTAICTAPYFPKIIYDDNWPFLCKFAMKFFAYFYVWFGYCLGIVHENFYAYTILHGHLQMKILKAYLRQELSRCETIDANSQIYSYKYQTLIEGVFLRCIKQHKKIADYGTKIINIYNRWIIFHVVTGVMLFSLLFYNYIFDPSGCEIGLIMILFQLVFGLIYYHAIGGLFSDSYDDFHTELLNVKWYTLNKTNRELYYMFLMFTQQRYEIELWPGLPMNRTLLSKFVKWIYTGVAVLRSMKSHK